MLALSNAMFRNHHAVWFVSSLWILKIVVGGKKSGYERKVEFILKTKNVKRIFKTDFFCKKDISFYWNFMYFVKSNRVRVPTKITLSILSFESFSLIYLSCLFFNFFSFYFYRLYLFFIYLWTVLCFLFYAWTLYKSHLQRVKPSLQCAKPSWTEKLWPSLQRYVKKFLKNPFSSFSKIFIYFLLIYEFVINSFVFLILCMDIEKISLTEGQTFLTAGQTFLNWGALTLFTEFGETIF